MTILDTTRPVAVPSLNRIGSVIVNLFAALSTWNDAQKTRKALSKLSARELDDIGLSHADLRNMAAITR